VSKSTPHISNESSTDASAGPWSPMRKSIFRSLWIATVVSNIATWMHNVGAAWLMTSLAPSPFMVSLVQAATSFPLFVLAIPSGALADVFDRRRLLLITQGWMLVAAAGLAVLAAFGQVSPMLLLIFTMALGIGAAFNAPAWQAIVPELVTREEIPAAVTLNSAGFNVSRAVGPALGGLIVAVAGAQATFGLNAVSFVGVLIVLYRWHREKSPSALPPEHLFGAMVAGLRYARHAPGFRNVLWRLLLFVFPASALWALLPLVARQELGMGASGYGVLLGAVGVGAVIGAYLFPILRKKLSVDLYTSIATISYSLALLALAMSRSLPLLLLAMLLAGAAWLIMLSSLNVAAQSVAASWVRARALSVYLIFFFGSMALGSLAWGALASAVTMPPAIAVSGCAAVLAIVANKRLTLTSAEGLDLSPSLHWPAPDLHRPLEGDSGPAMITVEYNIDPSRAQDFRHVMHDLRSSRLRDGAMQWNLFQDSSVPGRYLECFLVGSWLEHLRQHERVTATDRALQDRVRAFQRDATDPVVSHFVAERTDA
jgi:MFS family permease